MDNSKHYIYLIEGCIGRAIRSTLRLWPRGLERVRGRGDHKVGAFGCFSRLAKDTTGASLVEYTVMVGLVTFGTIGLVSAVGETVARDWTVLDSDLGTSGSGTAQDPNAAPTSSPHAAPNTTPSGGKPPVPDENLDGSTSA